MKISRLAGATALATTLIIAPAVAGAQVATDDTQTATNQTTAPAASQTSPEASVEQHIEDTRDDGGTEVTVTGSRIRGRKTIDSAVPIAVLTNTELLGARGDLSLGDALNLQPQFRTTYSQANSTGSIGTAGLNLLDLRGLGASRTLVLVNGRRVVTAVPGNYTPDISTIPTDLIERTEVVTGGNSAIYGSDAVSGVVNIITRTDFVGTRLNAQSGTTTYGDRGSYKISGVTGANFADDRVNLTVSAEYTKQNALYYNDRDYLGAYSGTPGFITSQITNAPNRNFDGIPNTNFVGRGITYSNLSLGGMVITSCPSTATAANATQRANNCTGQTTPTGGTIPYYFAFVNGGLVRNDASQGLVDNRAIGGGVLGGLGATGVEDAQLLPGQDRFVSSINLHGDFSPAFKPFFEGTFAHVTVHQQSTQPTFISGTLSPTFSVNNAFLTAAERTTLTNILSPGATTFTMYRFNNDLGTRAEDHRRNTYRAVLGVQGDISTTGNLHYEVAGNYGRTENFYRTGGNVIVANFNRAENAVVAPATFTGSNYVLNSAGQRVICAANSTTNAFPDCYPINLFGYGSPDPRAVNYVTYTSTRKQWAEEIDATAYLTGDSSGLFRLPGGPIGFAIGGEYRREDAFSGQDPVTASGATFLNPAATFDPDAVEIKEAYGELRVPLLSNLPFFHELTAEGSGRVSDYGGSTGRVTAWNAGLTWSPVRDLSFAGTLARSVRAPNLSNLYATAALTYANSLTDPCDQPGGTNSGNNITAGPNRAKNCAAAGIPTTITFTDPTTGATLTRPWTNQPSSGVAGYNQGNPGLTPEVGYSFTVQGVYTPHQVPGLLLKVSYYNIRIKNVISGLSGQQIINRCYDDAGGINNQFCAAVFRRSTTDPTTNLTFNGQSGRTIDTSSFSFSTAGNGISFLNQPYNFAKLTTRGIDFDVVYAHKFSDDISVSSHLTVGYLMDRLSYSYISEPARYDRIDSTLGDPKWSGTFNLAVAFKTFDLNYNLRYVGKQIVSGLSYETFFASQGRTATNPDARPFVFYDPIVYHNVRVGLRANDRFRLYLGVDNVTNELPPYELAGNENFTSGSTAAIYPNQGRTFYAGIETKF